MADEDATPSQDDFLPPEPEGDAAPSSETADEPEPVALETALSWLAALRPAPVLALLRDPQFALISMTAFVGFRVNAQGYANPLVRRRLAQEATRDRKFADRLRALAEEMPQKLPPVTETRPALPADAPGTTDAALDSADATQKRAEKLRVERDQRRRERDEARQAFAGAEAARTAAEDARRQAEDRQQAAEQQAERQTQRIARLERQVARLQAEQSDLLRALRREKNAAYDEQAPARRKDSSPASGLETAAPRTMISPWETAARHQLNKGRKELALVLAEDVLRGQPEDAAALDIAAQAQEARGERDASASLLRRLLAAALARQDFAQAGDALLRLLALTERPADEEKTVRSFLTALGTRTGGEAIEQTRAALTRLRGRSPGGHEWLASQIATFSPHLVSTLVPPPNALGPDDALPLDLIGRGVSARAAIEAVNAGSVPQVDALRAALNRLKDRDDEAYGRAWTALEQAADEDLSALIPLRREARGPAVVDGSNAAWFGQEYLSSGRPRLGPLLSLRQALRTRGYFPVVLFGDAPLPYTIDDPERLRLMLRRREMRLVDSGVDADEVLLREAKRLGAPLVTNDYMTDWDPLGEVHKVQYTISLTGEAHLLY